MKNILFVISNLEAGGAQRVVSELANRMQRDGDRISIALLFSQDVYYKIDENIQLFVYKKNEKNKLLEQYEKLKFIRQAIKDIQAEIVVSFLAEINIYVSFAMWNSPVKLIVSERNDPNREPESEVKKKLRRIAYRRPNGFVFQTKEAQEYFGNKIREKSVIIHNPVKENLPCCSEVDRNFNKIVSIGRLEPQKNYKLAIEIIKELVDENIPVEYCIYGLGNEKNNLAQYVHNWGLDNYIHFMGTSHTVHDEISDAGFFILTSYFEGLPNVLLEAMSMGMTVLATDCPCGGPHELIENGINGILVSVNDKDAFVEKIKELYFNHEKCFALGREAKKVKETHSMNVILGMWNDFIGKV